MFCPACGASLVPDSRFCSYCGAPVQTSSHAGSPSPAPHADAPIARLPTMGGDEAHAVSLPMRGPSRRAMGLAGTGLALSGIAIGVLVAWHAARRAEPPPRPLVPDPLVALIEMPRVLSAIDASAPPGDASVSAPVPVPAPATTSQITDAGATHAAPHERHHPSAPTPSPGPAIASNTSPTASPNVASVTPPGVPDPGTDPDPGAQNTPSPQQQPDPPASNDRTDATGTLDPEVIRSVYRDHRDQLSACQFIVAGNGGSTVGTIRLRVRVGTDGGVLRTRVVSDATHNELLTSCVETTVRQWRYPAPQGGEVEFEYNLAFGN